MSNTIYEHKADVIKALAHPIRIEILEILIREQQCTCDIATVLNIGQSTFSRHISVLKEAGLVQTSKDGVRLIVRIANPGVEQLLASVDDILKKKIKAQQNILLAVQKDRKFINY